MSEEETQLLVWHHRTKEKKRIEQKNISHSCNFSSDSGHLSTVVSEAFVRFFVELVGHYPLFITGEREDGYSSSSSSPVPCAFQWERFRKSIPSKTVRRFLEVFMETQMFSCFIQERELYQYTLKGTRGSSSQIQYWGQILWSWSCLFFGPRTVWSQGTGVSGLHSWERTPESEQVPQRPR